MALEEASLMALYNGIQKDKDVIIPLLEEIASLIISGSWPSNINTDSDLIDLITNIYIEAILDKETGIYILPITALKP